MRSKARREKCIELAYNYIRDNGPCMAEPILVEVNKEFGGLVMMRELGKYLAYLHGVGRIEGERLPDGGHMWRVAEA